MPRRQLSLGVRARDQPPGKNVLTPTPRQNSAGSAEPTRKILVAAFQPRCAVCPLANLQRQGKESRWQGVRGTCHQLSLLNSIRSRGHRALPASSF